MKCPIDDNNLVMTERSGVEIDYCPQCRGVWLDRGELDKIIDRASTMSAPAAPAPQQAPPQQYNQPRYDSRGAQPYYKKKRENWLSELFD